MKKQSTRVCPLAFLFCSRVTEGKGILSEFSPGEGAPPRTKRKEGSRSRDRNYATSNIELVSPLSLSRYISFPIVDTPWQASSISRSHGIPR